MPCVTQGTVQVDVRDNGQTTTVTINPVPDYRVKHGGKEFIVFMPDGKEEPRVFPILESFKVPDSEIATVLQEAATSGTKVEITINPYTNMVTAVKIPAPITKL